MRLLASAVALTAGAAEAKTINATSATLTAAFAAAKGGDTIVLAGTFGPTATQYHSYTSTVTVDASKATFTGAWKIQNVDNLAVIGGTFDYIDTPTYIAAINVYGGSNIRLDGGSFTDLGPRYGISVSGATGLTVTNAVFTNMGTSIGLRNVTGATISNNLTVGAGRDGIDIGASHDINVIHNSCLGGAPDPKAHPDCVQIYSAAGSPLSSNIVVSDNLAFGATQGFTKFGSGGDATNITITRNVVESTFPQGIACYGCIGSTISDNYLVTLASAAHFTNLNIVGGSANNVTGNVLLRTGTVTPYLPPLGSIWHDAGVLPAMPGTHIQPTHGATNAAYAGVVPEPQMWAMLVIGFGLIGSTLRRRRVDFALA